MAVLRQYDKEVYGRMEFLAYFILVFALMILAAGMFAFYNWLII